MRIIIISRYGNAAIFILRQCQIVTNDSMRRDCCGRMQD